MSHYVMLHVLSGNCIRSLPCSKKCSDFEGPAPQAGIVRGKSVDRFMAPRYLHSYHFLSFFISSTGGFLPVVYVVSHSSSRFLPIFPETAVSPVEFLPQRTIVRSSSRCRLHQSRNLWIDGDKQVGPQDVVWHMTRPTFGRCRFLDFPHAFRWLFLVFPNVFGDGE